MNSLKCTLWSVVVLSANLFANQRDDIINQLVIKELKWQKDRNKLDISWVYSGEGGAIRYAELDLVGDEKKEIIYDRTTRGEIFKTGKPNKVFYQSKVGTRPIQIEGNVPLYGFYKKEGGKSIFLSATEGRNFDTPDEKAFTRKLIIKEVSTSGVNNTVHLIDENTSKEIKELWIPALFPYEKKHVKLMEQRGFTTVSPKYKWVSLKDYISGDFEWKDYKYSNWSSLNEFSIESMTWKNNKKMITPKYLKLARRARELLKQNDTDVSSLEFKKLDLPHDYLTPQSAYRALVTQMPSAIPL